MMQAYLDTAGFIMGQYWWAVAMLLTSWNVIVYVIYALDKWRAETGGWRIRESDLLWAAFFGGAIGALAACIHTRHKTRKESFANALFRIAVFQMLLFGGLIGLTIIIT